MQKDHPTCDMIFTFDLIKTINYIVSELHAAIHDISELITYYTARTAFPVSNWLRTYSQCIISRDSILYEYLQ